MKIGMQTWGSNGDIRPFIALAEGLKNAGHEVNLLVTSLDNRNYAGLCQTVGIGYQQVPAHIDFDMTDFAQRSFTMHTLQWLHAFLQECFFPFEAELFANAKNLTAQHDIVIGHHFLTPLKIAAAQQHKPHISITFCHGAIPAPQSPPFRFPDLGRYLNRWQWQLFMAIFDWSLKPRLGRLWRSEGMPPIQQVCADLLASDLLNLVAVDPLLCPQRAQWDAKHQACGFLNLSAQAEDWQASTALEDFLAQGSQPVYMTFGSMQQALPDWCMELFIEASRLAGCRAIIQTSSARYPAESVQDHCFFIGRHPHQTLLRRCRAIVHHGGAGTTHSALLSACPSVVVPFMDEQLFWGKQLQQLGIAPAPLPAKHATAAQLAARLTEVLQTASMRQQAQHMTAQMQQTQGVERAIALIMAAVA